MTTLAEIRALDELRRSHDGPVPEWETRAAIRSSRTERENIEHDLGIARFCLQGRADKLRGFAHEVMHRHRDMREARLNCVGPVWFTAKRSWSEGRKDLRFYLDAFKSQRELVRGLEIRLMTMKVAA